MNTLASLLLSTAALIGLPGQGLAAVLPPDIAQALEQHAANFIKAPGFTETDITESCSHEAFYTPDRFPREGQSVFGPDADLDPLSKAVLLVDCAEGPLPHARYLVRYHLALIPRTDGMQRDYIEVLRFNFGPERYQQVIQYADQEFWPPKSVFGEGPNVAWRFVLGPIQGSRAHVEHSSRTELDQTTAKGQDCLGHPCQSDFNPYEQPGSWSALTVPPPAAAAFHEPDDAGDMPGPARMVQMLFLNATGGSGQAEYSESASLERPEMVFVISKNTWGQDSNISGLLHESGVMDDAISELWTQLHVMPESQPDWLQRVVYRPGRQ